MGHAGKILKFSEYLLDENNSINNITLDSKTIQDMQEKLDKVLQNQENRYNYEESAYIIELKKNNISVSEKCENLDKEISLMREKLKNAIPTHTISYLIINAIIFAIASVFLFLALFKNICLINPFYIISGLIVSAGLFLTALTSLKDWKEYLNND